VAWTAASQTAARALHQAARHLGCGRRSSTLQPGNSSRVYALNKLVGHLVIDWQLCSSWQLRSASTSANTRVAAFGRFAPGNPRWLGICALQQCTIGICALQQCTGAGTVTCNTGSAPCILPDSLVHSPAVQCALPLGCAHRA
jgi:hypothetical protein